jgi:hypothetical protein
MIFSWLTKSDPPFPSYRWFSTATILVSTLISSLFFQHCLSYPSAWLSHHFSFLSIILDGLVALAARANLCPQAFSWTRQLSPSISDYCSPKPVFFIPLFTFPSSSLMPSLFPTLLPTTTFVIQHVQSFSGIPSFWTTHSLHFISKNTKQTHYQHFLNRFRMLLSHQSLFLQLFHFFFFELLLL